MQRIAQSIDIGVPAHVAYQQLSQFENYPGFMQDVEAVRQLDDTHLHWTTKMADRNVEWDATIVEQIPDRCIAWHNTNGPANAGRVEVQEVSSQSSRVTMALESGTEHLPGSPPGDSEAKMSIRLRQDLARLKQVIEARNATTGGTDPDDTTLERAANRTTQSDYSLSQGADDAETQQAFTVAEEVNFDEQSEATRRVGRMPDKIDAAGPTHDPAEAVAESMRRRE